MEIIAAQARWISGPAYDYGEDDAGYYADHPNHVLVRRFDLGAVRSAVLRVAVLGYARVTLNGRPVSDEELLGDWTNPTKLVYQHEYDVLDNTFPYQQLTLADVGVPAWDVLHVSTKAGDRYIEMNKK